MYDDEHCNCHRCIKEFDLTDGHGLPISASRMIVCKTCGNKRCPKAADHRLACTGSNEPGQPGSAYQ
jgi:DNA-directed RNA polymerase subunit RPC12/RpoP